MLKTSQRNLMKDLRCLCEGIGVRLAGSKSEQEAAEYMKKRFLEFTPDVKFEEFPVMERAVTEEGVDVLLNDKWEHFPCSMLSSSKSTDGKPIKGEIVVFNSHTDYEREDLSFLTGKAVIHYGTHIKKEDYYRRLIEAKPAFLLMVDTRFTSDYPLADGLFPKLVKKYGAVPTAGVAFFDAWNWIGSNAKTAVLTIAGGMRKSTGQNVIATIPGVTDECIYVSAHHDTQADTVGADDNAVGCVMLLELARILSAKKHLRTIRLCSFSAEEQLSQGAFAYVMAHEREIAEKGKFICNFDSCGGLAGFNYFNVSGNGKLCKIVRDVLHRHDVYYEENLEPEPFLDQFPFTAQGLPGMTFERHNCESGMFYHHRDINTIDKLSTKIIAQLNDAAADLLCKLADRPSMDAISVLPATFARKAALLWNEIFK